ncbi:MAG: energy transducer TonB [Candidatus Acidiferrum sp.]
MRTLVLLPLLLFFSVPFGVKAQDTIETKMSQEDVARKHPEVHPAVLIKRVAPEYPRKAKKAHIEGTVRLHAVIAKDGSVQNLAVLSGDPVLVDAALKAVRQWRYQPTQINGKPVEIDTRIDVVFALHKNP